MKKILLLILLIVFSMAGIAQSTKSGQTDNRKKKKPSIQRTPPKNWGKKKYTNPIKSKLSQEETSWDIGLTLGAANSLTDIYGNNEESRGFIMDMQLSQTNLAGGAYLRYKFSNFMAVNTSLSYLKLEGADSLSKIESKQLRNYSFTNNIIEFAAKLEFYRPQPVSLFKRKNTTSFDYYLYTGLAGFYHKPEFVDNKIIDDPNLPTNNNRFDDPNLYSDMQVGIPFGLGFYFTLPSKIRIGGEGYWMKTFTDFIDGYSTTAGDRNDNYLSAKLSVGYIFREGSKSKRRW